MDTSDIVRGLFEEAAIDKGEMPKAERFAATYAPHIERALQLAILKQLDYGPTNIAQTGLLGVTVRMTDKVSRLVNLTVNKGKRHVDETVRDTLTDLLNYAVFGLMLLDAEWGTWEDGPVDEK